MKLLIAGKTATIMAAGYVGAGKFTYEVLLEHLSEVAAKKADTLIMELSTVGGDVFTAMDMYNEISKLSIATKVIIGAVCASAGTVIISAFKEREAHKNSLLMVHRPSVTRKMTSSDVEEVGNLLKINEPNFLDIYEKTMTLTRAEIAEKWMKDWWMSAEEAKAIGLVTAIKTSTAIADKGALAAIAIPDNYLSILNSTDIMKTNPVLIAAFKKASVTLAEDADESALIAATESLANAAVAASAKVSELQTKVNELNSQLAEASKAKAKALVAGAKAAGKINDNQVAYYEALAEKDFTAIEKILAAIEAPKVPTVAEIIEAVKGGSVKAEDKDFGWYQKNDPSYLENLMSTDKVAFDKLKSEYSAKLRKA